MALVAYDVIVARGSTVVRALHRTTFEITRDSYLTPRGDCIIAIGSNKGARDLSPEVRASIASDRAIVVVELVCNGVRDTVVCRGSSKLRLSDSRRIVVRRSRYVDGSTLCVESNKAARDLKRELVTELQRGGVLVAKVFVLRV
ncbi:MAG: DUF371 domain-containing protein [Crenarchaeota archaeon]|nr:DUF371 domain-containing protein [Thermoproteota archaeon]